MRLSCLQENLSRGLSIAGRAVLPDHDAHSGNVLLATDHGQLKLAATNMELSIVHWVGARVETEGEITVPARNFIDLMNSLPPDQVSLSLDEATMTLALTCGSVKASFRASRQMSSCWCSNLDSNAGFTVEAEALNKGLTQVTFAASTDESHPVLTGVLAGAPGQTMTLAAADGFRLSLREIPWLMLCQRRSV